MCQALDGKLGRHPAYTCCAAPMGALAYPALVRCRRAFRGLTWMWRPSVPIATPSSVSHLVLPEPAAALLLWLPRLLRCAHYAAPAAAARHAAPARPSHPTCPRRLSPAAGSCAALDACRACSSHKRPQGPHSADGGAPAPAARPLQPARRRGAAASCGSGSQAAATRSFWAAHGQRQRLAHRPSGGTLASPAVCCGG